MVGGQDESKVGGSVLQLFTESSCCQFTVGGIQARVFRSLHLLTVASERPWLSKVLSSFAT